MSEQKEAKGTKEVFAFTPEMEEKALNFLARYPEDRSANAVMPLLDLAQRQNGGWLSQAGMDYVADRLGLAPIRVYEVATFYSMYKLKPELCYLAVVSNGKSQRCFYLFLQELIFFRLIHQTQCHEYC